MRENPVNKVFLVSEQRIRKNCPPMHPWRRSTTTAYVTDEELPRMERRARDPVTGRTYLVPADMSCHDRYEKYVGGKPEAEESQKSLDKPNEPGILEPENVKEVVEVHSVGKIDREIYKCITDDIVTDEVIITDERIGHIRERHPNDYERYYAYLKEIVECPDYIIEANKPNTALILKEIIESNEKQFKTVLRLTTSIDNPNFKNSIITFMKVNEKEWNRLIRNKKILYKKE